MRDRTPTKVLDNGALRYGVYDESGTFLRHEYLALDDAPTDTGTDLSKANLLKDTTAALFGLGTDAVPDDALSYLGQYAEHWWMLKASNGSTTYAHSTDRATYPDSGTVDGITYTYLGVPFEHIPRIPLLCQLEQGSYVGTGTYGASNKNSLTFSSKPILFIITNNDREEWSIVIRPNAWGISTNASNYALRYVTWSDNSISWYNADSSSYQFNLSGKTYYYIVGFEKLAGVTLT